MRLSITGDFRYLYTGKISLEFGELQRVIQLAELLELTTLVKYLTEVPHLGHIDQVVTCPADIGHMLESVCDQDDHSDITFQLEDGCLAAHKVRI